MGQAGRGKALNLTIDRMSLRPKARIGKCSGETIQVSGVVKRYVWELKSASMARPAGKIWEFGLFRMLEVKVRVHEGALEGTKRRCEPEAPAKLADGKAGANGAADAGLQSRPGK